MKLRIFDFFSGKYRQKPDDPNDVEQEGKLSVTFYTVVCEYIYGAEGVSLHFGEELIFHANI